MELIGTALAAEKLGVTQSRVRAMIKAGQLPTTKLGRDHFIDPKDLALVKDRKPGRPRKTEPQISLAARKPRVHSSSQVRAKR